MAELGAIVGESGSGKSSSIRNLDSEKTFIINIARKPLPFRGHKKKYVPLVQGADKKFTGNLYNTSSPDTISKVFKIIDKGMLHIKYVILDDSQYLMSFEAMDRAGEKSYDKFVQIAQHFYSILKEAMDMREDLKVFILTHSENTGDALNPSYKIKTVGKMIDNMITVEGLFTYVLFTTNKLKDDEGKILYKFITQSDGTTTAKTPMGCFSEMYIDNDLQLVFDTIDAYNEG
jgi:dsDNA-binding SOS-regulon protein